MAGCNLREAQSQQTASAWHKLCIRVKALWYNVTLHFRLTVSKKVCKSHDNSYQLFVPIIHPCALWDHIRKVIIVLRCFALLFLCLLQSYWSELHQPGGPAPFKVGCSCNSSTGNKRTSVAALQTALSIQYAPAFSIACSAFPLDSILTQICCCRCVVLGICVTL